MYDFMLWLIDDVLMSPTIAPGVTFILIILIAVSVVVIISGSRGEPSEED